MQLQCPEEGQSLAKLCRSGRGLEALPSHLTGALTSVLTLNFDTKKIQEILMAQTLTTAKMGSFEQAAEAALSSANKL